MKYLICPDKFKGSMTAREVCAALEKGILHHAIKASIVSIPMADGGDGSIDIISSVLEHEIIKVQTEDPLGRKIHASFLKCGQRAFLELAAASGLVLVAESERNPLLTTTEGTGILIRSAIKEGCKEINLFIGGSATNDGAMGIARALGYRFFDIDNKELIPVGANLGAVEIIRFEGTVDIQGIVFNVICDVDNQFYGPDGAAHTYARQKGADDHSIASLDRGLRVFGNRLVQSGYADVGNVRGAGAAGGVGGGMKALFNARLISGVEMFFEMFDLGKKISEADVIVTGEGKLDDQSFKGKVVGRISAACAEVNKSCIVACGTKALAEQGRSYVGLGKVYAIEELSGSKEEAMSNASEYLIQIGQQVAKDAE